MGDGSSSPGTGTEAGGDDPDFDQKASPGASRQGTLNETTGVSNDTSTPNNASSTAQGNVSDAAAAELAVHSPSTTALSNVNAPTPSEFANQTFADGVQSRAVRAGMDGHESLPLDPNSNVIGSWQAYDPGDVVATAPIGDKVADAGRTEAWMEHQTLADNDIRAANEAYVTDYESPGQGMHAPSIENAHNQMGISSALDAMGVRGPRHAYDSVNNKVAVESVPQSSYDATRAEPKDINPDYAERVDADQLKDVFAANIICGNGDLKPDNIMVGEDGAITAFDYDFANNFNDTADVAASWGRQIDQTIDVINNNRSDDLGITSDDVLDRTEELATQLKESGAVDRVTEAASQYDDYFRGKGSKETRTSNRVQHHVDSFSQ